MPPWGQRMWARLGSRLWVGTMMIPCIFHPPDIIGYLTPKAGALEGVVWRLMIYFGILGSVLSPGTYQLCELGSYLTFKPQDPSLKMGYSHLSHRGMRITELNMDNKQMYHDHYQEIQYSGRKILHRSSNHLMSTRIYH